MEELRSNVWLHTRCREAYDSAKITPRDDDGVDSDDASVKMSPVAQSKLDEMEWSRCVHNIVGDVHTCSHAPSKLLVTMSVFLTDYEDDDEFHGEQRDASSCPSVDRSNEPRGLISLSPAQTSMSGGGDQCVVVLSGLIPKSMRGPCELRGTCVSQRLSPQGHRWGQNQVRGSINAPVDVTWLLNLGVDINVPVIQAPVQDQSRPKVDRYGFTKVVEDSPVLSSRNGSSDRTCSSSLELSASDGGDSTPDRVDKDGENATTVDDRKNQKSQHQSTDAVRPSVAFFTRSVRKKKESARDRRHRVALETSRAAKWISMLRSSAHHKDGIFRHSKLSSRAWKGIPDALRSTVWPMLARATGREDKRSERTLFRGKTYEEHLACAMDPKNHTAESRPGGVIDRDLQRTFPDALLLKESKGQRALRNVLVAYHNYDRKLQYTQGMNFITAMFLSYMPERDAFWLLVAVMSPEMRQYHLADLLLIDNGVLWTFCDVLERLIAKHLPRLSKHFRKINVKVMHITMDWILTVFTSSFPFEFVLRVWDVFLLHGWSAFFRAALALLQQHRDHLLTCTFDGTMLFLKNKTVPSFCSMIDIERVMKTAQKYRNMDERHINALFRECKISKNV